MKIFLLIVCGFLISYSVRGQSEEFEKLKNPRAFLNKLEESIIDISSIKSEFTQEKNLDIFEETIFSKGRFFYEKTDKVRWEYTDPIDYTIIMNGEDVLIISDDKKKKYDLKSNKFIELVNKVMVGSIQGQILSDEDMFDVEYYENVDYYQAKLIPKMKEVKDVLQYVRMFFDKKDMSVSKLKFIEYTGDYTLIIFENKIFNEAIPKNIFSID